MAALDRVRKSGEVPFEMLFKCCKKYARAVVARTLNTSRVAGGLSVNPTINTAFSSSPSFFAIGELVAGITSALNPTQLASPHDLLIGLYDRTAVSGAF